MSKFIATQVNPECQRNTWAEEYMDHSNIRAWTYNWMDRQVTSCDHIEMWEQAEGLISDAEIYEQAILSGKWDRNDRSYNNVREFVEACLYYRHLTPHDLRAIIKAIREYFTAGAHTKSPWERTYVREKEECIAAICSVLDGKTYRIKGFTGYSQGDYINICYAEEDWPEGNIGFLAADALGQYSEWLIVKEGDERGSEMSTIVYDNYGSAPSRVGDAVAQLRETAKDMGMKPGDTLVIRTIDGWHRVPAYNETEVAA